MGCSRAFRKCFCLKVNFETFGHTTTIILVTVIIRVTVGLHRDTKGEAVSCTLRICRACVTLSSAVTNSGVKCSSCLNRDQ